jgi:hypothetical protein
VLASMAHAIRTKRSLGIVASPQLLRDLIEARLHRLLQFGLSRLNRASADPLEITLGSFRKSLILLGKLLQLISHGERRRGSSHFPKVGSMLPVAPRALCRCS